MSKKDTLVMLGGKHITLSIHCAKSINQFHEVKAMKELHEDADVHCEVGFCSVILRVRPHMH